METDLVIIAVGTGANPLLTQTTAGLNLNKWGYIIADEKDGKDLKKGVWAGGDIVTGSATVILAMGAGRNAANSMRISDPRLVISGCRHMNAKPIIGWSV